MLNNKIVYDRIYNSCVCVVVFYYPSVDVLFAWEVIHQTPWCFLEHEPLPSLLSTGWFQERIRA